MTRLALALLLTLALTATAQETNAPRIACDAPSTNSARS